MKESTVSMALEVFSNFGMVEIVEGVITIPNWNKHQTLDAYEKKKERDRLYQAERRANQRALIEKSSDESSYVAISEEEREKEEEKEKDKENSIYLSGNEALGKSEFSTVFSTELSTTVAFREETKRKLMCGELGRGVVFMSQYQMDDLLDKLSIEEFNHYVGVVADCIEKGKPFRKKTHYQAILDMAIADQKIL
jgi:hypothetical protein